MNKNVVLHELFFALHSLDNLHKGNESKEIYGLIGDNVWDAIIEICEIEAHGHFGGKVREYVMERIYTGVYKDDEPYRDIISTLTNSVIKIPNDY